MEGNGWEVGEAAKVECEEAKKAGCIFYDLPWQIDWKFIDPLIRPIIERLNASEYVWTAESCEGHPDAIDAGAWGSNTSPMLRLIARKRDQGTVIYRLMEAYDAVRKEAEANKQIFELGGFRIYPQVKGSWAETLVYVAARNIYQRNQGLAVFAKFAELVTS